MTENWLSPNVSKQSFHDCLFLVTSFDVVTTYCLTLKIWNEPCPPRCPYYKLGPPGSLEDLETGRHILSSWKFSRRLTTRDKATLYCRQYFIQEPYCQECGYSQK